MYQLSQPDPALAPFIENYWFVTSREHEGIDLTVNVFVDGRADLIFNWGAAYERQVIHGDSQMIQESNLDAQRLEPIRIR